MHGIRTSLHVSTLALALLLTGCTCPKFTLSLPTIQPLSRIHAALRSLPRPETSELDEFEQCSVRVGPDRKNHAGTNSSVGRDPNEDIIGQVRSIEAAIAQRLGQELSGSLESFIRAITAQTAKTRVDFALHHKAFVILAQAADQFQPSLVTDEFMQSELKDQKPFFKLLTLYHRDYFGSPAFKAGSGAGTEEGQLILETGGFVDRNGNAVAFPTWSLAINQGGNKLSVSATSINSARISSDLIRLFVEALFDSIFYVPAQPQSSAAMDKLKLFANSENAYPTWDTIQFKDQNGTIVTPIVKESIFFASTQTEALATAAMGKAIRGGLVGGLNNETLAAAVETAAGVTAKKLTEHEVYCYFNARYGRTTDERQRNR